MSVEKLCQGFSTLLHRLISEKCEAIILRSDYFDIGLYFFHTQNSKNILRYCTKEVGRIVISTTAQLNFDIADWEKAVKARGVLCRRAVRWRPCRGHLCWSTNCAVFELRWTLPRCCGCVRGLGSPRGPGSCRGICRR